MDKVILFLHCMFPATNVGGICNVCRAFYGFPRPTLMEQVLPYFLCVPRLTSRGNVMLLLPLMLSNINFDGTCIAVLLCMSHKTDVDGTFNAFFFKKYFHRPTLMGKVMRFLRVILYKCNV